MSWNHIKSSKQQVITAAKTLQAAGRPGTQSTIPPAFGYPEDPDGGVPLHWPFPKGVSTVLPPVALFGLVARYTYLC